VRGLCKQCLDINFKCVNTVNLHYCVRVVIAWHSNHHNHYNNYSRGKYSCLERSNANTICSYIYTTHQHTVVVRKYMYTHNTPTYCSDTQAHVYTQHTNTLGWYTSTCIYTTHQHTVVVHKYMYIHNTVVVT